MEYSQKEVSKDTLERLWKASNRKMRVFLKTSYYLMLRCAETARINLRDINNIEHYIIIREQKNGWSNENYPIPEALRKDLYSWMDDNIERIEASGGWIFFSQKTTGRGHLTTGAIRAYMIRKREQLGFLDYFRISKDGRKYYKLSHHTHKTTAIKEAHRKTKNLVLTQALAHHKSHISTMRYIGKPSCSELAEVQKDVF